MAPTRRQKDRQWERFSDFVNFLGPGFAYICILLYALTDDEHLLGTMTPNIRSTMVAQRKYETMQGRIKNCLGLLNPYVRVQTSQTMTGETMTKRNQLTIHSSCGGERETVAWSMLNYPWFIC